ncbi:MAG: peptidase domain-containing ABC transporter [Gemmatimonadota bacterium]|nr:peptidase domain-containing ABC transporter [Gemmatimonadota bacterium]
MRVPRVRQRDVTDCGAACLASVARHYGLALPIARVRELACTDQRGTNVLGMIAGAERMGLSAKGVRGGASALASIPAPAILHLSLAGGRHHYVVLYGVTSKRVTVMDPADGRVHRIPRDMFAERWTGVAILLAPSAEFERGDHTISAMRRLWRLARPHRSVMTQAMAGAVACTLLGLSTSIFVQKIVDHVLIDGDRHLLDLMGAIMLALLAAQIAIGTMKNVLMLRTAQRLDAQLILGYYRHLLALPQRFFDTMRVGEIISRVNDAVKIRAFINETAIALVVDVMVVFFSLAMIAAYAPVLAVGMLALVPLYGLIYVATNAVNRRRQRVLMERMADMEAQFVESLNAASTIKRFGLEQHAGLRTETRVVRLLRVVYDAAIAAILSGGGTELVSRLATIALLWVGAALVLAQRLTPGQLMSCYALLAYLTGPVTSLIGANRAAQDALIAADRLFEIMDLEREEQTPGVALSSDLIGDIRFHDVSFRYGTRALVLDALSVVLPRGRTTAIVGESGSGKSTIAALLHRLYPVASGVITVGEHDLRYLSAESLRRIIGVVPQQIDIFAQSVLENIAIGDGEPDARRVLAVCAMLGLTDVIRDMPDGLYSQLGERGANLSGGQRQRLAIARALYRDPEILVLDEATSSLDSISEEYVQRALAQLRESGKTIILIAHRLSTVRRADKIVVLSEGRVAEEGTHQHLLSRRGVYHRLWRLQADVVESDSPLFEPRERRTVEHVTVGSEA